MVNASLRHGLRVPAPAPAPAAALRLMMNKSLRGREEESRGKGFYGFRAVGVCRRALPQRDDAGAKKEPPFPAAFEVDNREASNRVDRSHSVSKRGRCQS